MNMMMMLTLIRLMLTRMRMRTIMIAMVRLILIMMAKLMVLMIRTMIVAMLLIADVLCMIAHGMEADHKISVLQRFVEITSFEFVQYQPQIQSKF